MPKRDKLFKDMQGDDRQAALLVAQVGGMPNELQLIVETAQYDAEKEGLRPLHNYIIRILGVMEHRIVNLGTTVETVRLLDEHPLLYQYNKPPCALFFRGEPSGDVNSLVLDIAQVHASTFGPWRRFPEYLNVEQALYNLLKSGGGLLGQMPLPLADNLVPLLEKYGLESKIMQSESEAEKHKNPMLSEQKPHVLFIGASYFISYAFSVDEMGKV